MSLREKRKDPFSLGLVFWPGTRDAIMRLPASVIVMANRKSKHLPQDKEYVSLYVKHFRKDFREKLERIRRILSESGEKFTFEDVLDRVIAFGIEHELQRALLFSSLHREAEWGLG